MGISLCGFIFLFIHIIKPLRQKYLKKINNLQIIPVDMWITYVDNFFILFITFQRIV